VSGLKSGSSSRVTSAVRMSARGLARSMFRTSTWLKQAIWAWPIAAALLLGTFGLFIRGSIESTIHQKLSSGLEVLLNAEVTAMRFWMQSQERAARSIAIDDSVVLNAASLAARMNQSGIDQFDAKQLELLQAPELKVLREKLTPFCQASGFDGWIIATSESVIVASDRNELLGITVPAVDQPFCNEALEGATVISPPRKSTVLLPDQKGESKVGLPTMFLWTSLTDDVGRRFAAVGLRIPPEKEFTRIASLAQVGDTGETYLVARNGELVSASRFDSQLREIGLLTEDQSSMLNLSVRDPGVDLTEGERSAISRSQQPLTVAAQNVLSGNSGLNMDGYRDYRGVMVVGAWHWLPEYQMGLILEQDRAEAYRPLFLLRNGFWSMFAVLGLSSVAIFVFMLMLRRQQRDAQKAALELRRLGQYTLEEKLGEGGMGVVYRGHHAMLHRPTAIKFLSADRTNDQTIARFEREVRLTARLSHPNTIAVYDYGRTPEGTFYYAMECLEGINLEDLVTKFGPQPEGRVIHILKQICGSLAEAHSIGLIHRDVKPANIYLTRRAGLYDFVKLLDFGLVKAVDGAKQVRLTQAGAMAGTPLYMAPEAISNPDSVDGRSDLYAVGAVGYFLLTGTTVFRGHNIMEILQSHANAVVERPSDRLGRKVSTQLEDLLLQCLEKDPDKRPSSAADVTEQLDLLSRSVSWSTRDAAARWSNDSLDTTVITSQQPATAALLGATVIGDRTTQT
jgi:serine/threonine protein kinase